MLKMRRSYKIAIASVSCALAVIAVVAQAYVSTVSIAINVIAALAVSLPLTQKSAGAAIFSYVAAALIGFLAVNIKALPFIVFYAPYAIIQYLLDFVFYRSEKIKLPKWAKISLITVFKLGFFAVAFYACLMLMKVAIADIALFGITWTLPLLMVAGLVAFCAYDPLYRFVFVNMQKIVVKYAGGNRRNGGRKDADGNKSVSRTDVFPEGDVEVFDGFSDGKDAKSDASDKEDKGNKENGKNGQDESKTDRDGDNTSEAEKS